MLKCQIPKVSNWESYGTRNYGSIVVNYTLMVRESPMIKRIKKKVMRKTITIVKPKILLKPLSETDAKHSKCGYKLSWRRWKGKREGRK